MELIMDIVKKKDFKLYNFLIKSAFSFDIEESVKHPNNSSKVHSLSTKSEEF